MASSCSFDVVSDFDYQEMVNTVDQVRREIKGRYDLKDTNTVLDLNPTEIVITTNSEFTLDAVTTILQMKAAKRQLSLKIFEYGKIESVSGSRVRQEITLRKGIEAELAKKISKQIRDVFKKIQVSIQGDALRVSGKSRDDLQEVIQFLKQEDCPVALQFENYR
ncbi:YajQ family cyclic di-GMP-binding protein [Prochlorothrix hollandica]|uniref:YajQ family cyclic di-GMP-binding protein n=1 Tax=Prochlorothrix hollandica TaxID=1223 RepID=UPI00333F487C